MHADDAQSGFGLALARRPSLSSPSSRKSIAATSSARTQFNRLRGGDIAYRQGPDLPQLRHVHRRADARVQDLRIRPRDPALPGRPGRDLRAHHLLPDGRQRLPGGEHGRDRRAACRAPRDQRLPPADGRLAALPQIRPQQLRGPVVEPDHAGRRGGVRQPRSAGSPAGCSPRPTSKAWWPRPTNNLRSISAACAR